MKLPASLKLSVEYHFEGLVHFEGLHCKSLKHEVAGCRQSVSPLAYKLGSFLSLEQDLAQDSKELCYPCHQVSIPEKSENAA